jgi:hypothetical protein
MRPQSMASFFRAVETFIQTITERSLPFRTLCELVERRRTDTICHFPGGLEQRKPVFGNCYGMQC